MKNLKKIAALAVSIIMILSFSGCQTVSDSLDEKTSSDSSVHDHSDNANGTIKDGIYTTDDYSIKLGSDWQKTDDTTNSNIAMFGHGENSYSNINIRIECLNQSSEFNIEQYKELTAEQFNSLDGYKVTKTTDAEIDGKKAFKIYIDMNSGESKMKMIQSYIVSNEDVYVYSFLTSSKEYKKMKSEAEEILNSFKFAN